MSTRRAVPLSLPPLPPPPPNLLHLDSAPSRRSTTASTSLNHPLVDLDWSTDEEDGSSKERSSQTPSSAGSSTDLSALSDQDGRRRGISGGSNRNDRLWQQGGKRQPDSLVGELRRLSLATKHRHWLKTMPLSSRIGCQLLYHGVLGHEKLLDSKRVEKIFRTWSIREGRRFDSPINPLPRIRRYIKAYHIDLSDLLEPDLARYATLNDFFFRKLRPDARPIASPQDPTIVSSAADCRLTVFESVTAATKLWIKGTHFTLEELLGDSRLAKQMRDGCVAIFRLAPSDYHRYHSPVDGIVGRTKHLSGTYYTVNSLIVRDKRFNPLGQNKRDVTVISTSLPGGGTFPVAFVQVGALLVSSIRQSVPRGAVVRRGDELGYFAYGGSTIVLVTPKDTVEWDADLVANSRGDNDQTLQLETRVKVGERIGRWRV